MAENSQGKIRQEIIDYIDKAVFATLATVRSDGAPVVRAMAAFALSDDGTSVYFATLPQAEKTKHISGNNKVSFFFQHENQQFETFKNAEVIGRATKITTPDEVFRVAGLISERSPYVKDTIAQNGLGFFDFYVISASEVKFLDFSRGIGPQAVETISI